MKSIENNFISELELLSRIMKLQRKQAKSERDQKIQDKLVQLKKAVNFKLSLIYLKKQDSNLYYEEISLEGFKNASIIFNQYRSLGHSLKLRSMTLFCSEEKVQKVDFKYKNELEKR